MAVAAVLAPEALPAKNYAPAPETATAVRGGFERLAPAIFVGKALASHSRHGEGASDTSETCGACFHIKRQVPVGAAKFSNFAALGCWADGVMADVNQNEGHA